MEYMTRSISKNNKTRKWNRRDSYFCYHHSNNTNHFRPNLKQNKSPYFYFGLIRFWKYQSQTNGAFIIFVLLQNQQLIKGCFQLHTSTKQHLYLQTNWEISNMSFNLVSIE